MTKRITFEEPRIEVMGDLELVGGCSCSCTDDCNCGYVKSNEEIS